MIELLAFADFDYHVEINLLNEDNFLGGYIGSWTAPWVALENTDEIIFHVLAKDKPSDDETIDLLFNLEELSKVVPPPEIKTKQD